MRDRLLGVYDRLLSAYGRQHWWPAETPFEVIVGAILTQSAAWANVERALANLKRAGALHPESSFERPVEACALPPAPIEELEDVQTRDER